MIFDYTQGASPGLCCLALLGPAALSGSKPKASGSAGVIFIPALESLSDEVEMVKGKDKEWFNK